MDLQLLPNRSVEIVGTSLAGLPMHAVGPPVGWQCQSTLRRLRTARRLDRLLVRKVTWDRALTDIVIVVTVHASSEGVESSALKIRHYGGASLSTGAGQISAVGPVATLRRGTMVYHPKFGALLRVAPRTTVRPVSLALHAPSTHMLGGHASKMWPNTLKIRAC
ncbi:hypothetical protein [Rhodococcus opacus]|uniref:hypothetical protein n=1 Tax=Rhodococcus opacus TaxID=37919 RepID=UPI001C438384|nr:hypothetical protein [Rhodococcus opacus]MBV6760396.1 hypothetical protein [Rhodococcus opacus]